MKFITNIVMIFSICIMLFSIFLTTLCWMKLTGNTDNPFFNTCNKNLEEIISNMKKNYNKNIILIRQGFPTNKKDINNDFKAPKNDSAVLMEKEDTKSIEVSIIKR